MNTKTNMIFIKGEIKTSEIKSCEYSTSNQRWNVQYKGGGNYPYSYTNVEWLKTPQVLNPQMYRISRENREFFNIQEIYVFRNQNNRFWHICFGDGSERDYYESDLTIKESCLSTKQAENVFLYLKQLSQLSEVRSPENGEKLLPKRYEKIDFIGNDVALSRYVGSRGSKNNNGCEWIPIFPFGCNNSQYKAVKNAMENQISIIQGPPGTGKTQTILNIIANIVMQGKTVQVVSNNNSAIDNIYDKLADSNYNLDFIVATLGKTENRRKFIQNQSKDYPTFTEWLINEDTPICIDSIKKKSLELQQVFDYEEKKAKLQQELAELQLEIKYFHQYLNESNFVIENMSFNGRITSRDLMNLWQMCQVKADRNQQIGICFKIRAFFQYGINKWNFYKNHISEIITAIQNAFYDYKYKELELELLEITKILKKTNQSLMQEMCNDSIKLLKDKLARRYGEKGSRQKFTEEDLWKNSQIVLAEYPVVLSTTFSSKSSLNRELIFDYLIMDEASQVDLVTGGLALSCARNAVIVGDTKQLPNVVTPVVKVQADAIFQLFRLQEGYRYSKSFLQSVLDVIPNVKQTLLREHYRCHPKIINFCNQKFYQGELIIMTKDYGEPDVLAAVKTVEGNHARGHYSQRQIDIIKNEIIPNYVVDKEKTGIIAPYKQQVEALENEFSDIDVATVHKFQGREKDTIIISTVDDEITDFVDDPYLLNVAISRAKKKLMIVVSGNEQSKERNVNDLVDYIKYNNFEVSASKVYSVFDYLYKQYSISRRAYLKKYKKVSEFDSENLVDALITDIISSNEYTTMEVVCHFPMNMLIKNLELLNDEECRYAMNPATHLDFLIFNKITKVPMLAVEVDGYQFHKEDTLQAKRDSLKNHIVELYEIPLLRFATNGSGEREKLISKLKELLANIE